SCGRVWVGTSEGLHLFPDTTSVWMDEGKKVLNPEGKETWRVSCLLEASDGSIWASPGKGNTVYLYASGGPVALPTPISQVRSIYEDSLGRFWIGDRATDG